MTYTWRSTIVAVSICVSSTCFWEGGVEGTAVAPYLPIALQTDFSDLDARDAQNRPISQPAAFGELDVLFRQNLSDLMGRAAPHSMRSIVEAWASISGLFNKGFLIPFVRLFSLVETAFLSAVRRVVHNVNKLWITISDGSSQHTPVLLLKSLSRTPQQLFLRC